MTSLARHEIHALCRCGVPCSSGSDAYRGLQPTCAGTNLLNTPMSASTCCRKASGLSCCIQVWPMKIQTLIQSTAPDVLGCSNQFVELELLAADGARLTSLEPFINARQVKLVVASRRYRRIFCDRRCGVMRVHGSMCACVAPGSGDELPYHPCTVPSRWGRRPRQQLPTPALQHNCQVYSSRLPNPTWLGLLASMVTVRMCAMQLTANNSRALRIIAPSFRFALDDPRDSCKPGSANRQQWAW